MISCAGFINKRVAVLGLGKSGLAAARALTLSGARVFAWDDGEACREKAQKEGISIREFSRVNWGQVDALVISPGIAHTFPKSHPAAHDAKQAGVPIIGDVELLATSGTQAPQIAITGTNGKSTTTSLLGHIVEQSGRTVEIGGNLGPSIGNMTMMERDGLYVLELSSYQLELCPSAHFKIAVLMNISPDHLDRHGGMAGYVQAKTNIFHNQGVGDVAIVGLDDEPSRKIFNDLDRLTGRVVIPVATTRKAPGGVYVEDGNLIDDLTGDATVIMNLDGLANLPGIHNAQNCVAVYAAARKIRVDIEDIIEGIKSFPGLAHRQEIIEYFDGITFVNDSKATNAEAAQKAVACYDNVYLIVGGRAKETGLRGIGDLNKHIRKAFLIGECAEAFAAELEGKVEFEICGDLDTATHAARDAAKNDGLDHPVVLLSPACASFDQFKNFEDRGDAFRAIVDTMRLERASA
ncbi:MAG: UDP-N-acetylmuramoyl-L-alanine--D-glutamate ligase [Rhodospirillaceae bacterium]|nr:MAG: UDP-N-acetylmuramoyl-L-alanine--D-glutamate ligase [Rhodospirillaceae bacterium]